MAAYLWSATSYKSLREEAMAVERANRLSPGDQPLMPLVTRLLAESEGPIVAVTDFMRSVPDQIARWIPDGRRYTSLGTDGYGRSDTREALRRYFETDAAHVVVAVLAGLAADGKADDETVLKAAKEWEVMQVNDLREEIHATPALSDGRIYVRTHDNLYCFAARE